MRFICVLAKKIGDSLLELSSGELLSIYPDFHYERGIMGFFLLRKFGTRKIVVKFRRLGMVDSDKDQGKGQESRVTPASILTICDNLKNPNLTPSSTIQFQLSTILRNSTQILNIKNIFPFRRGSKMTQLYRFCKFQHCTKVVTQQNH